MRLMVFSSLSALKYLSEDCERSTRCAARLCVEPTARRKEMAAVCPQWECCVSGTVTPALIRRAPTRLCLGSTAKLLYSKATGIQMHIKHTHTYINKFCVRSRPAWLSGFYTQIMALSVIALWQIKPNVNCRPVSSSPPGCRCHH